MKDIFLQAMSRVASSVCVVTTDGPAGKFGVTISAMTSVSVDTPRPTLLVCIHERAGACAAILKNRGFCANLLSSAQSDVADCFAGRTNETGAARFKTGTWRTGESGAPMLEGGLASFDCTLMSEMLIGSHRVFVGETLEITSRSGGKPLIYHDRDYAMPTGLST